MSRKLFGQTFIRRAANAVAVVTAVFAVAEPTLAQDPQNSATINGALLGADVQHQNAERAKNAEALRQALKGFPRDALTVHVVNLEPHAKNPNQINASYTLGISPEWLARLRTSLSALAVARYQSQGRPSVPSNSPYDKFGQMIASGQQGREWGARFCIYGAGLSDCYLLPPGNYGEGTLIPENALGMVTPPPLVTIRLSAADGTPTSGCLVRDLNKFPNVISSDDRAKLLGRLGGMQTLYINRANVNFFVGHYYVLYTDEASGAFYIMTKEADLAKSVKMDLRPAFSAYRDAQHSFIMDGVLGQPNSFAVADMTEQPTEHDICKLR